LAGPYGVEERKRKNHLGYTKSYRVVQQYLPLLSNFCYAQHGQGFRIEKLAYVGVESQVLSPVSNSPFISAHNIHIKNEKHKLTPYQDIFIIATSSCARFMPSHSGYSALSVSANGNGRGGRHSRAEDENRLIDQLDEEWDD
jgi:hypothetical protein